MDAFFALRIVPFPASVPEAAAGEGQIEGTATIA